MLLPLLLQFAVGSGSGVPAAPFRPPPRATTSRAVTMPSVSNHAECLALAERDPVGGRVAAERWRIAGGGFAARQCAARCHNRASGCPRSRTAKGSRSCRRCCHPSARRERRALTQIRYQLSHPEDKVVASTILHLLAILPPPHCWLSRIFHEIRGDDARTYWAGAVEALAVTPLAGGELIVSRGNIVRCGIA